MGWTEEEMRRAKLIHGPDSMNSDTYRLWIHGENNQPGKYLDVPGFMVGDPRGTNLRVRAAAVIRERLASPERDDA